MKAILLASILLVLTACAPSTPRPDYVSTAPPPLAFADLATRTSLPTELPSKTPHSEKTVTPTLMLTTTGTPYKIYLAGAGGSCATIASKFKIEIDAFLAANPSLKNNCASIKSGQSYLIPPPGLVLTTPTTAKIATVTPTKKVLPTSTRAATLAPTRPPAPTVDPNATAMCKDGTLSYSKHRAGTCSGHGGVQYWINKPPN